MKRKIVIFFLMTLFTANYISVTGTINSEKNIENLGENNVLATVDIIHYIFRDNFVFMKINITPGDIREYNFTEIDGKVQMNFTIILNHRLYKNNIKNRGTILAADIGDSINKDVIYISDWEYFPCNSTNIETEYFAIDNVIMDCYTNGTNKTLTVAIYIKQGIGLLQFPPGRSFWYGAVHYPFPLRWLNCLLYVKNSEFDINVIPIPV